MKRSFLKGMLSAVLALALLLSCILPGLVMPAMAADDVTVTFNSAEMTSAALEVPSVHLMTGRYRDMSAVVKFTVKTTATGSSQVSDTISRTLTSEHGMTWSVADTNIATVDANGRVTPKAIGTTTLTGTFPSSYTTTFTKTVGEDENAKTFSQEYTYDLYTKFNSVTINLTVIDGSEYVYFEPEYTLGENVIPNGDLEAGSTSWSQYSTKITDAATTDFVQGVGKDGSAAMQLKSGANWQTAVLNHYVTAGNLYMLSFDYKANKGNKFSIYGGNMSFDEITFDLTGSKGTGEWKTYTLLFKMNYISTGNRNLYFYHKSSNDDAPVVIDNISLREYTSSVEIESLVMNHSTKKMLVGQSFRIEALTEPYGGDVNDLVWSTSDEAVVSVQGANGTQYSNDKRIAYGLIKAVGAGTATITATTADGKFTATCEITVSGGKGGSLLEDPSLDAMNKKAWKTLSGKTGKFSATAGAEGSAALVVDRYDPVSQTFTGLLPNTTYTLQGLVKTMPSNGMVVVTVVNGSQTLVTVTDAYTAWGTTAEGEAALSAGVKFTTPAELESDETTVHIGVVLSNEDKAPVLVTEAATFGARAVTVGNVEMGESDVTDDEEDITVCTAYVDCLDIYKDAATGVDLTPTYVQWKGDDNNDGQVTPGTQITFEVPVKNAGTGDLPAGDEFVIEIAANREVIRTIRYDGGIPAGKTVVITDTEAWTAVEGDYMISARVNADYDVVETNPNTNQTYQLNLRVANDVYAPTYNNDIIAQAGMDRLTLSDDFNDYSSIDTMASGDEGYKWYITRPWSAGRLTPHDFKTENGVLTLKNEVPTYGIALNSVDMITNNGYRFNTGYLEVKLRIPRPTDNDAHESGVPTVWSFTEDKAMENITGTDTHWVELDWLEYWGNTNQYPGGYYTTTFHNSTTVAADPAYTNSNPHLQGLGDAEWHVMGWLWEKGKVRTFLDGKEMMNLFISDDASAVPAPRATKTDENKKTIGSGTDAGVFSWANVEEAVLYLGGSKDNPELIDYVRIWQTSEPEVVSDNMTLDKTTVTMDERDREQLNVTAPNGEDLGTLTWKSSDPKVVTVHGNGELYARGTGKALVTAANANGTTVMCVVTVEHNIATNGDFEEDNDLLHKVMPALVSGDGYDVVDDGTGNHVYSMKYNSTSVKYYNNIPAKKNTTYVLTGKFKGPAQLSIYFNYTNKSETTVGSGSGESTSWQTFSVEFTTNSSFNNNNYLLGFRNKYSYKKNFLSTTKTYTCLIDDLKLVEKDAQTQTSYTLSVNDMENGSITMKANGAAISSGATLTPGTLVDVTVEPNSGYQLKLGSLTYGYKLPSVSGGNKHEKKILNESTETFGGTAGATFRFVMPEEDTTLNAVFEQIAASTTTVATLGTSLYVEDEKVSGVRFLNRMYYSRMEGSDIYVMYNGAEHKVKQFGTLLKRATNDIELTLDAYNEHKNDASATRIWKSEALRYGNMYLVDYTDRYVDFTITMTSSVANKYSFITRDYEVCGYMVLEDGTTVYTDSFADDVLTAQTRAL